MGRINWFNVDLDEPVNGSRKPGLGSLINLGTTDVDASSPASTGAIVYSVLEIEFAVAIRRMVFILNCSIARRGLMLETGDFATTI
jgi:hypothetical protein